MLLLVENILHKILKLPGYQGYQGYQDGEQQGGYRTYQMVFKYVFIGRSHAAPRCHSRRFNREYGVGFKTRSPIESFGDDNLFCKSLMKQKFYPSWSKRQTEGYAATTGQNICIFSCLPKIPLISLRKVSSSGVGLQILFTIRVRL